MPLPHREPTALDLRLFGGSLALLLTGVGVLVWRAGLSRAAIAVWILAAVLCAGYYARPAWRRPMFLAWLRAMSPVAWLMSALVLGILYFGLITPIGLLSRLAGRDPLRLRSPPTVGWIARPGPSPKSRYFRQH